MRKTMLWVLLLLSGCSSIHFVSTTIEEDYTLNKQGIDQNYQPQTGYQVIYLAGGCFWGVEKLVESIPGVISGTSGYANGQFANPTYEQVKTGTTDFRETVRVEYDPQQVSLETILYDYFYVIDPSQRNQQGHDIGSQYQTGIYFNDEASAKVIEKVVAVEKKRNKAFYVEIKPLKNFYEAEEYHQNYLDKNPNGYCHIHPEAFERVSKIIVDPSLYNLPSMTEIREELTDIQYEVTQNKMTDKPFDNEYDAFFEEGIYVDIVTGEPLFSSKDKYDSGCGWPAFTQPIDEQAVVEKEDNSHFMQRIEVVSRTGDSHLGHKFEEDRSSSSGIRYCINSSSLRFVPKEKMEEEGYGYLLKLFLEEQQ